uniref:Uncharacterized protein n=1 Tax=Siphoviridae sp. ctr2f5 TaxID=2825684 RepID=A0A8S5QEN2_9CAUD|nr:MAG TPA: hypothetical protein [Siphoviridae sp. ctr2f5]
MCQRWECISPYKTDYAGMGRTLKLKSRQLT